MDATTFGFGIVWLAALVMFAVWLRRRTRGPAPANPFEVDRALGPDRSRGFGPGEPGSWPPGNGRW